MNQKKDTAMAVFYMKELVKPSCFFMICCGHTAVQYLGLPMAVFI